LIFGDGIVFICLGTLQDRITLLCRNSSNYLLDTHVIVCRAIHMIVWPLEELFWWEIAIALRTSQIKFTLWF
jgi:hypothetical protein